MILPVLRFYDIVKKTKITSLQKRTEHYLISTSFRSKTNWKIFSVVLGFFFFRASDIFGAHSV